MSTPTRFWWALESVPDLATSAYEWRSLLGPDWEWAKPLLRPTQQQVESILIGSDLHRIVVHGPNRINAVPEDYGPTQPLQMDDITVYEVHRRVLARLLCSAFDFERTDGRGLSDRSLVGWLSATRTTKCPVHLCIQTDPSRTGAAIRRLLVMSDQPMVILTPRQLDDEDTRQILRLRDACHLDLDTALEFDASGRAMPTEAAQRTLGAFRSVVEQWELGVRPGESYEFRRDGRVWILTFNQVSRPIPHKDASGLAYIQHLLARPGQLLPVERLEEMVSGDLSVRAASTGEAVVDKAGFASIWDEMQYTQREIEMAERIGDVAAQDRLHAEFDELTEQVQSVQGLGGRVRTIGDDTEKLRTKITQSIKRAIKMVNNDLPTLGAYLDNSITTGKSMVYRPDSPIEWVF